MDQDKCGILRNCFFQKNGCLSLLDFQLLLEELVDLIFSFLENAIQRNLILNIEGEFRPK